MTNKKSNWSTQLRTSFKTLGNGVFFLSVKNLLKLITSKRRKFPLNWTLFPLHYLAEHYSHFLIIFIILGHIFQCLQAVDSNFGLNTQRSPQITVDVLHPIIIASWSQSFTNQHHQTLSCCSWRKGTYNRLSDTATNISILIGTMINHVPIILMLW